jgi:hypothetical protein
VSLRNSVSKKVNMPVISALRRLRQEDHEFIASLGYIVSFRQSRLHSESISQKKKKNKMKRKQKEK